jgi:hypothetical protein
MFHEKDEKRNGSKKKGKEKEEGEVIIRKKCDCLFVIIA